MSLGSILLFLSQKKVTIAKCRCKVQLEKIARGSHICTGGFIGVLALVPFWLVIIIKEKKKSLQESSKVHDGRQTVLWVWHPTQQLFSALEPSIFALSIERSFAMLVKPKRLDNASDCYGHTVYQI